MAAFSSPQRSALVAVGLVLALTGASLSIVGEGQQAVVERMGQPDRVINRFQPGAAQGGGLIAHVPLLERVVLLDRGLVSWTAPAAQIVTTDQQTLMVDSAVTYRIIDPVRLVGTLGSGQGVGEQLGTVLPALLNQELAQRSAAEISRPGIGGTGARLRAALDARMRGYGVQVIDLRLTRVQLAEGTLQAAYDRMEGRHERQVREIELQSARDAQEVTAEGDVRAAEILQASAGRDPEFYGYFRALRSYELTYGDPGRKNKATIVIPPNSAYLRHFNGQ